MSVFINGIVSIVRHGKDKMEWASSKLLQGAGTGSDPTEIDVPSAGVSDPHGAGQHSDVTRYVFLPASEGNVFGGTPGYIQKYSVIKGGANADEPVVQFSMRIPDDFVSFVSIKMVWRSTAASGNMRLKLTAYYASSGEVEDTHSDFGAWSVSATGGANKWNVQEPSGSLSLSGIVVDDYLGLEFNRGGAHVDDTLDTEVQLLGMLFTYTAHQ